MSSLLVPNDRRRLRWQTSGGGWDGGGRRVTAGSSSLGEWQPPAAVREDDDSSESQGYCPIWAVTSDGHLVDGVEDIDILISLITTDAYGATQVGLLDTG